MSRKINVIACGGFGQNIMMAMIKREFFPLVQEHVQLFAVDTSEANLRRYNTEDLKALVSTHLVPKADGSGGFRGENNEPIEKLVKNLVDSDAIPEGMVIVVASASGGSGAVAAGELIQTLAKRGRSVFGMMLETDEDDQKVTNTWKTVKTLQGKASAGTNNFSVFWEKNRDAEGNNRRVVADQRFLENLENLIAIGHPLMGKLDTKDIHHFLNYPIRSKEPGELRFISIRSRCEDQEFEESADVPIAILSLLSRDDIDPDLPRGVGYSTHGILPSNIDFTDKRVETQFLIHGGRVAKLASTLEATIKEYDKIQQDQKAKAAGNELRASENDNISESGTFL